jgi:hypothetical protein
MNRGPRVLLVAVASAGLPLTASPAWAHDTAPEGSGDWVPVEQLRPDYYEPFSGPACGTTVTVSSGDVREVEARETVQEDGSTLTEIRGDATVDVTREDTGQTIDELDVSGAGYDLLSADGAQLTVYLEANSILLVMDNPVDLAAFDAAGLPHLTYYTKGTVTFHVTLDPATGEPSAVEIDNNARRVVDLCDWFEDDAADRKDRRHHGHDHDHAWKN